MYIHTYEGVANLLNLPMVTTFMTFGIKFYSMEFKLGLFSEMKIVEKLMLNCLQPVVIVNKIFRNE